MPRWPAGRLRGSGRSSLAGRSGDEGHGRQGAAMAVPSASYAITMRVVLRPDPLGIGRVATAVGEAGGTANAVDIDHVQALTDAVNAIEGVRVHKISDRTFLLHLGGKLEVVSKVPLRTRDDLSMAYTPGVARVCKAIVERPEDARRLTIKRNTVAVVTDGSAVLGLGNIGPAAALPVMEGKAVLFKEFGGVDAFPVCLDTQDTEEIIRTCQLIAPVFGGINLEDIAAPRCFEIERRLRESLDIPVFHDDQHGTAIVVLAALLNAVRLVDKPIVGLRVVIAGAGAAGVAVTKILQTEGVQDVTVCDRNGAIHTGRETLDESKRRLAAHTNPHGRTGALTEVLIDADVFIGVD